MKVIISDIQQKELKGRLKAYLDLFGLMREEVTVKVGGFFQEHKTGELVFLNRGLYDLDTSLLFKPYLTVKVDGEWAQIVPGHGVIDTVQFEKR